MNRREVILNTAAMAVSASLGAIACGASSATAQRGGGVPPETATALAATRRRAPLASSTASVWPQPATRR
jgi:hypothetical protein